MELPHEPPVFLRCSSSSSHSTGNYVLPVPVKRIENEEWKWIILLRKRFSDHRIQHDLVDPVCEMAEDCHAVLPGERAVNGDRVTGTEQGTARL
jgi:hypothetical protein